MEDKEEKKKDKEEKQEENKQQENEKNEVEEEEKKEQNNDYQEYGDHKGNKKYSYNTNNKKDYDDEDEEEENYNKKGGSGNIIINQNGKNIKQKKQKDGNSKYNTFDITNNNYLGIQQNNEIEIKKGIDNLIEEIKKDIEYLKIPEKANEEQNKIKDNTKSANDQLKKDFNEAIKEYTMSTGEVESLSCGILTKLFSSLDDKIQLCQDDYYDFKESYKEYKTNIKKLKSKYKKFEVLDLLDTFENSIENISPGQITDEDDITTTTNKLFQVVLDDYLNIPTLKWLWLKILDLFQQKDHDTATQNFLVLCKSINEEVYKYNKAKSKQERDPYLIKISSLLSQLKEASLFMSLSEEQTSLIKQLSDNIIGAKDSGLSKKTIDMTKFSNSLVKLFGAKITNKSLQTALKVNNNTPSIINKLKDNFKNNIDYKKLKNKDYLSGDKEKEIIQKTLDSYFDTEDTVDIKDIEEIIIKKEDKDNEDKKEENKTKTEEIKKNIYGNVYKEKILIDSALEVENLKHNAFYYSNENQKEIDLAKKLCEATKANLEDFRRNTIQKISMLIDGVECFFANNKDFDISKSHTYESQLKNILSTIRNYRHQIIRLDENVKSNSKAQVKEEKKTKERIVNGVKKKEIEIEYTKEQPESPKIEEEEKKLTDKKKGAKYLLEALKKIKEDDNTECEIMADINKRLDDCKNIVKERTSKFFDIYYGESNAVKKELDEIENRLNALLSQQHNQNTTMGAKIQELRDKDFQEKKELKKMDNETQIAVSKNEMNKFKEGVEMGLDSMRNKMFNRRGSY